MCALDPDSGRAATGMATLSTAPVTLLLTVGKIAGLNKQPTTRVIRRKNVQTTEFAQSIAETR